MNSFNFLFEHTHSLEKNFVSGSRETISFAQLYQHSVKLAEYLAEKAGQSQNILLIAPNSIFFIKAYLAILRSGNVVVPLNPEIEQKNLDYIREKCDSKLIFITEKLASKYQLNGISGLNERETDSIIWNTAISESLQADTPDDQLAEIIFTSGSTGEPKGVMISHKNLIANTSSIIEYLHLTEKDTMLVVLPFYYCYGLSLLHTHLRIGGCIVLKNLFIMLGGFISDLKRFRCTGFAGVPSHFQILLRKSDSFKTSDFPDLRYVTQAGGKLHYSFIREFIEAFPSIRFNVMYGQTEATARLSWLPPEKLSEKIGSCGKAIPGVKLKVINSHGMPVKPGEIGEILASGDNIMQGYYKDPVSTAQTLRNGWLHTGDLATVDNEGYIYLTARKKEIIKVGGRRISPKEIEEVIFFIPGVVDCTIEGVYDELLGETIKATVVTSGIKDSAITKESILQLCSQRLSRYKIPQIIEFTDQLNITTTGKKVISL